MGRRISVINAEIIEQAEQELKKIGSTCLIAIRLQSIIAAYRHGVQKACEVLDLSRDTIHRWMRDYKEHDTAGLENSNKPSRSALTDQQKIRIKEWLAEEPTCTLKILVHKCSEEFGINIGKSSIHRFIKAAGYSHITGRKKHYKTDVAEQELFKKTKR